MEEGERDCVWKRERESRSTVSRVNLGTDIPGWEFPPYSACHENSQDESCWQADPPGANTICPYQSTVSQVIRGRKIPMWAFPRV